MSAKPTCATCGNPVAFNRAGKRIIVLSCQVCPWKPAPNVASSRLRRGLCPTHYQKWLRAGRPPMATLLPSKRPAAKPAPSYPIRRSMHARHAANQYGLSEADYHAMWDAQHGACAICSASLEHGTCYIDHNHDTGEVRGMLCSPCNTGLGMFKDNSLLLGSAARYLTERGSYAESRGQSA